PRIPTLAALLPQGRRARPPLRRRAHRPSAFARSAQPVRRGPPRVRGGPEAERRRRRAVVRPRPSGGQQRKRRGREEHLEGPDRSPLAPRRLVVGHRGTPRVPPRRGRSLPLARRRGRGGRKRAHPASRPPASRSDPPGSSLPDLAAQSGTRRRLMPPYRSPTTWRVLSAVRLV